MNWPPMELFWERVRKDPDGCWTWIKGRRGAKDKPNPIIIYKTKPYNARRWAWALQRENPTRTLRTLCGNRMCVNPAHHEEWGTRRFCNRGHLLTTDNVYMSQKARNCKECVRIRQNTPRQKLLVRERNRKAFLRLNADQIARREAAKQRYLAREKLLKTIDNELVCWSPSLSRWLLWEGHRWIKVDDQVAQWNVSKYLDAAELTPKSEEKRSRYVNDIMRRLKKVRKPMEEEAA